VKIIRQAAKTRGTIEEEWCVCIFRKIEAVSVKPLHVPSAGRVASYMIFLGVVPRLKRLLGGGFAHIAFLVAQVYGIVRLLPPGHPYLDPRNIGRFGVRHAVGEAANHLVLDWRHADQILVFAVILAGIVLFVAQVAALLAGLLLPAAQAVNFYTPNPTDDVALNLLDYTLGVKDFFCTGSLCTSTNALIPFPFHDGLHALLRFYSVAILLIAIFIFLYFVVVVVVESAVSGTPFGERFQNWWVVLRLLVALGLLMPLGSGLNSGQYIVLYAAKMGSGWATNAWVEFNDVMMRKGGPNPLGQQGNLVAMPGNQEAAQLVLDMALIKGCAYGYWQQGGYSGSGPPKGKVKPYLTKLGHTMEIARASDFDAAAAQYKKAVEFSDYNDILIVFGYQEDGWPAWQEMKPVCGILRVPVSDLADFDKDPQAAGGGAYMRVKYWQIVNAMWFDDTNLYNLVGRAMEMNSRIGDNKACSLGGGAYMPGHPECLSTLPSGAFKQDLINAYQAEFNAAQIAAWKTYNDRSVGDAMRVKVMARGWAYSGAWYNEVATHNALFQDGLGDVPSLRDPPLAMKQVAAERSKREPRSPPKDKYNPTLSSGGDVSIRESAKGLEVARGLSALYVYFQGDQMDQARGEDAYSGNVFTTIMNWLFGLDGLLAINGDNADIHPLAQLVAVGRGLVNSTVRNIMISTVTTTFGPLLPPPLSIVPNIFDDILWSTAFVGLTAGVTLFYVLPFLPFLFVFFAAGSWIKGIFEAMVAVPLWALAHLRIDGEGLPGEAAANGYFLVFEIFIRPILTVAGLVAAIIILSAQVRVLHFIWAWVVANVSGFDESATSFDMGFFTLPRGEADQLAFTIVYVVVVYMLANASFKLIDTIPDNVLRWLGTEAKSFSDTDKNPSETLVSYASVGGMTLGQQIVGGARGGLEQVGGTLGRALWARKGTP
jgi:conjugal transfer/type IV secretion protein DotA/TraY